MKRRRFPEEGYVTPAAQVTLDAAKLYDEDKAVLIGEAWEYIQTLSWRPIDDDALLIYLGESLVKLDLLDYYRSAFEPEVMRRRLFEMVYEVIE